MSDKIYAAIPEDFIRRMRNWARAVSGVDCGGGSCCNSSIYELGVRVDRYVNSTVPTMQGEADDTDAALKLVPIRYQQAVRGFWLYEGRSLRAHARALRHNLSHETFEQWVMTGHEALRAELAVKWHWHRARFHELATC